MTASSGIVDPGEVTLTGQLELMRLVAKQLASALQSSQTYIAVGSVAHTGYNKTRDRVTVANNDALTLWEQCAKDPQ